MDKDTRNLIFNTTQAIRRLLEEEFALQLEGTFDVHPDGRVAAQPGPQLTPAERLIRQRIVEAIRHRRASHESDVESVRGYLSEAVFTCLNRLAALKMMEARGLVLPCVSQFDQSQGFKEFSGLAPGLIELPDRGYRLYLECLFDEIGREVGVLFDRTDAASQLWPRRKALETVLEKLNVPALAGVWGEDETIGWIYQYYNDPEERAIMRDPKRGGSAAPRNSRELAVRNQFFTPRYVVEFLTDNTLGRLWYEMTLGETKLREQCRYLIRRPNEIFLNDGDVIAPPSPFDESLSEIIGDPREAHRKIFLQADPDDYYPPCGWLKDAYGGRFENLPMDSEDPDTFWVGAAISPRTIESIIGEKWEPFENDNKLTRLTRSIYEGNPAPETLKLPVAWAILSAFARTSQFGGGYELPYWKKLWSHFRSLAQAWQRSGASSGTNLSQEDLLKQPVHIPHRPLKDPRTILMLDPACGSMHFGLYAFDLFEVIYDEAWALEEKLGPEALSRPPGMKSLHDTYAGKDAFLKEVPKLIIEHNIHGIDIDPRAAQIAGLALWLRAQKAWKQLGLKPADRPAIRRSNIVCAEPMPGEKELLATFVAESFPPAEQPFFQKLLEAVFEQMNLAGEAGSLLQIEEEIRSMVHEAREAWKRLGKHSGELFAEVEIARGDQRAGAELPLDLGSWSLDALTGIPDAQFWERAEGLIYGALKAFAERADSSAGFQRRLFADDAARGFAFIDLCNKRYDVALMNPPFGDASLPSKPYLDDTYGDTKGDVYKAFVECFHARLVPAGYLGIISSRTGFFLGQSEDWRTRVVLRLFRPIALADLGSGVLDAMVEVAAYVLRSLSAPEARDLTHSIVPVLGKVVRDSQDRFSLPKWQAARGGLKRHQAVAELEHLEAHGFIQRSPGDIVRYTPLWDLVKKVTAPPEPVFPPLVCVRAVGDDEKGNALEGAIRNPTDRRVFIANPAHFAELPGRPFAYWAPNSLRRVFREYGPFEAEKRRVRQGGVTGNDTKYLRGWWEVAPKEAAPGDVQWVPYAKGGRFSPFFADIPMLVRWHFSRCTFFSFTGLPHRPSEKPSSADSYFSKGLTWPLRAHHFAPVPLPSNSVFSIRGYAILCDNEGELLPLLAVGNSSVFDFIFKLALGRFGFPEFVVGILQKLPLPDVNDEFADSLAAHARRAWETRRGLDTVHSTSHAFLSPALLAVQGSTLAERAAAWADRVRTSEETVAAIQAEIDDLAFRLYGLDAADRAALTSTLATEATGDADAEAGEDEEEEAATADAPALAADLLAYALGCAFGRWDIRYATGERPAPPAPDPFAPLPVCPPGMLQNAVGLPATPADVLADYPTPIVWDGILLDDRGHSLDIESRVRDVLTIFWPDRVDAIVEEACGLLGVKSLRDWFRKPAGFFADHLKRYFKSRRQAPIYWPLSSPHGLYTVWLYYHRLTPDTLFSVLRDQVKPKLEYEERRAFQLRQEAGPTPSPSQRGDIAEADELVEDLRVFRDELNRVAALFRPNLNDGVIINHAPLWRMIGLPKWRKDCQGVWEALANGSYDWAHLAMHLWPDRVIRNCATDRSLAIAHGLDEVFWEEFEDKPGKPLKWRPKKVPDAEVEKLIANRMSPAVSAALESLKKFR
jgi:hypothetical protein